MECFTTPGINRTTLFREVIGIVYLATDSGNPQKVLHRKRARCARSLSAQALHCKRTMRAACPSYIGRPGKQPAGSIQAESAPKAGYRGVGERLEAVEHGSYAPDGPLGASSTHRCPVCLNHSQLTLRQRRGESSQDHGDQAGRDGGTKKRQGIK